MATRKFRHTNTQKKLAEVEVPWHEFKFHHQIHVHVQDARAHVLHGPSTVSTSTK